MKIGILGATGRMGRAIGEVAGDMAIPVVCDALDLARLADPRVVLIDFTAPDALDRHLRIARETRTPIVIGTTGLMPEHHAAIDEAARDIPVLQAPNTSLGVNLLAGLVEQAANRLGPDWDIEILEMHHRHKVDAPSGTALLLGASAARGRKSDLGAAQTDRNGRREDGAIGYASLRGGSVAGDHMVILATEGERIELGHRAESRAIFARGAVKAAQWLVDQPAGRYAMTDVLGL